MTVCMVQVDRWWRVVALFFRKNEIEREANEVRLFRMLHDGTVCFG